MKQRRGTVPTRVSSGSFRVKGIYVEYAKPRRRANPIPLLFVHGGCHGSWAWENYLRHFASKGWESYALNWYNHYKSVALPRERFVNRSIADVVEEIDHVVARLGRTPALIGHSMGGLASQKYAEAHGVEALVLITPVVPAEVSAVPIEVPVRQGEPWGPPPLDWARENFFLGSPEKDVQRYYALLSAESPRAVYEATRWTVHIDKTRVSHPILVIGAELDRLTPPDAERKLADFYGGDYRYVRGKGHNLLLEPAWVQTATSIERWLRRLLPPEAV